MPFGPGTYSGGRGGDASTLGIPQGVLPSQAPDDEALGDIIKMLRAGQVGSDRFLQLLSLLAAQVAPEQPQAPQGAQGPQGPIQSVLG